MYAFHLAIVTIVTACLTFAIVGLPTTPLNFLITSLVGIMWFPAIGIIYFGLVQFFTGD